MSISRILGGLCFAASGIFVLHQVGAVVDMNVVPSPFGTVWAVLLLALWAYAPQEVRYSESWKRGLRYTDFYFILCSSSILAGIAWNLYRGITLSHVNQASIFGGRGAAAYFSFRIGAQLWHRIP